MKLRSFFLVLAASLFALAAPRTASGADVSFDFFFDSLSPYGDWIELEDYGYSWRPGGVDADWTPYSDGYWTYTDAGWTWVSYEDFGGIVYHYGRWVNTEDDGWCWVPDYEWGPAWVSWRRSDDYVGWAPLPAEALWERNRGISVWVDTSYDIGPRSYNFCRVRDFGAPVLRPVIVRRAENVVIIRNTVNVTNITFNTGAGCVFNGGLDYGFMNRHVRRQIPALKLVRNTNVTVVNNTIINNNVRVTNFNAVQRGNQLTVLAPTVVRPQREQIAAIVQPRVTKVVPRQKTDRGWGSITGEQRESIRTSFAQQTRDLTPETAPAKPVKAEDLKMVPKKADPNAKVALPKMPARPIPGGPPAGTPPVIAADPVEKKPAPAKLPPAATEAITGGRNTALPTPRVPRGGDLPPTRPLRPDAPEQPPKSPVTRTPAVPAAPMPTASKPEPIAKPPTAVVPARPVRPGVTKPFNPGDEPDTPPAVVRSRATPAPNPTIEKRNAALEAARQRSAEQAAQRQRMLEESRKRPVETPPTVRAKPPEPDRNLLLQRQQQEQARARAAAESRERMMEQQRQQQAALKARAADANEARTRVLQQQQQQSQLRARQQAAERAQESRQRVVVPPQNVRPQNVRPPAPQVQRGPTVPQQPTRAKRALTPEEAAELKKGR